MFNYNYNYTASDKYNCYYTALYHILYSINSTFHSKCLSVSVKMFALSSCINVVNESGDSSAGLFDAFWQTHCPASMVMLMCVSINKSINHIINQSFNQSIRVRTQNMHISGAAFKCWY